MEQFITSFVPFLGRKNPHLGMKWGVFWGSPGFLGLGMGGTRAGLVGVNNWWTEVLNKNLFLSKNSNFLFTSRFKWISGSPAITLYCLLENFLLFAWGWRSKSQKVIQRSGKGKQFYPSSIISKRAKNFFLRIRRSSEVRMESWKSRSRLDRIFVLQEMQS